MVLLDGAGLWLLAYVSSILMIGVVVQNISRAVPVSACQRCDDARDYLLSAPNLWNVRVVRLVVRIVSWRVQAAEPGHQRLGLDGEAIRDACVHSVKEGTHQTSSSSMSSRVTLEELAAGLDGASSAEFEND